MKKNIQRQGGLLPTKNLLHHLTQGYVIAQKLLQDPYLISGRKINCRVYFFG